jgi:predicted ribosome-associated RNA-binding protein Tma20
MISENVCDKHFFRKSAGFSFFFDLKNVFPTVKILTFSRGEFKYVQMDQGLNRHTPSAYVFLI